MLAEHIWNEQHKILWEGVDIVGQETNGIKRKIMGGVFHGGDRGLYQSAK
ncbi:MAG: hypothetical protein ACTS73_10015 [Arsenophonus sp. NEOnobi-MAG3]